MVKKDMILEEFETDRGDIFYDRINDNKDPSVREEINLFEQLFELEVDVFNEKNNKGEIEKENPEGSENLNEINIKKYFTEWIKKLKFIFFFSYKQSSFIINNFIKRNSNKNINYDNGNLNFDLIKNNSFSKINLNNNYLKRISSNNSERAESKNSIEDLNEIKINDKIRKSLLKSNSNNFNKKDEYDKLNQKMSESLNIIIQFMTDDKIYIFDIIQNINANYIKNKFREISVIIINNILMYFPKDAINLKINFILNFYQSFCQNSYILKQQTKKLETKTNNLNNNILQDHTLPNILSGLQNKGDREPEKLEFLFENFLDIITNIIFDINKYSDEINPYLCVGPLINCLNWKFSSNNIENLSKTGFIGKFFINPEHKIFQISSKLLFSSPMKLIELDNELNLSKFDEKRQLDKPIFKLPKLFEFHDLFYVEKFLTRVFKNFCLNAFKNISKKLKKNENLNKLIMKENIYNINVENIQNHDFYQILISKEDEKILLNVFNILYKLLDENNKNNSQQTLKNDITLFNEGVKNKYKYMVNFHLNYCKNIKNKNLYFFKLNEDIETQNALKISSSNNLVSFIFNLLLTNERILKLILNSNFEMKEFSIPKSIFRDFFVKIFIKLENTNETNSEYILKIIKIFIKNLDYDFDPELKSSKNEIKKFKILDEFIYEIINYYNVKYYKVIDLIEGNMSKNELIDEELKNFIINDELFKKEINKSYLLEFLHEKNLLNCDGEIIFNNDFSYNGIIIFILFINEYNTILRNLAKYSKSEYKLGNNFYNSLCELIRFIFSIDNFKSKINSFIFRIFEKNSNDKFYKYEYKEIFEKLQNYIFDILGFYEYTIKDYSQVISNFSISFFNPDKKQSFFEKFNSDNLYGNIINNNSIQKISKILYLSFKKIKLIYDNEIYFKMEENSLIKNILKFLTQNKFDNSYNFLKDHDTQGNRYKFFSLGTTDNTINLSKIEKLENDYLKFIQKLTNFEDINLENKSLKSSVLTMFIDEDNFNNFLFTSFQISIESDKNLNFIKLLINMFDYHFFLNNNASIISYRNNIYILRFFKMILLEYEKIRKLNILENINLIKDDYNIEDEENEAKFKLYQTIKFCGEEIFEYFLKNSENILKYTKISIYRNYFNIDIIFNFERIFLFNNIELYKNSIFKEEIFDRFILGKNNLTEEEKEIFDCEFNLDEDSKKEQNDNSFYFKISEKYMKLLKTGFYNQKVKLEKQFKCDFHHILTQDIRFIYLYSIHIFKSQENYLNFLIGLNDYKQIIKKLTHELKLSKLLFNQYIYKYFYFDLKSDYDVLVNIINKIICKLIKIDLLEYSQRYINSEDIKDEIGKLNNLKLILKNIDIKTLPLNIECCSEYSTAENFVKYFHVVALNLIREYLYENLNNFNEENIYKKIKNQSQIQMLHNQHNQDNNYLIDIKINVFSDSKNYIFNSSLIMYNLNGFYHIIKYLVRDFLLKYFMNEDEFNKENSKCNNFFTYLLDYVKKIFEFLNDKINEINKFREENTEYSEVDIKILKIYKEFIENVYLLFAGFNTKQKQKNHKIYLLENVFNKSKSVENENPENIYLYLKTLINNNNTDKTIIREFIMSLFYLKMNIYTYFPNDVVFKNNFNNLSENFIFIRDYDVIQNKVNSFHFKKLIETKVYKNLLLDLFSFNFKLPLIKEFYMINIRNYQETEMKIIYSNSKDFSESFIYLNELDIKNCFPNLIKGPLINDANLFDSLDKFKKRNIKLADPDNTRFSDFSIFEKNFKSLIIFPDLVRKADLLGIEIFLNNNIGKKISKINNIKNIKSNNYYYIDKNIIYNRKKITEINEIKEKDLKSIFAKIEIIKKKEKILNLFDDSILITDKSIYIFNNFDSYKKIFPNKNNTINDQDEYINFNFQNCEDIRKEIFINAKCNDNCLILLTLKNKVLYVGSLIQNFTNTEGTKINKFPEKITFLNGFLCYDLALMKDAIFFVLQKKHEKNARKLYSYCNGKIQYDNDSSTHFKTIEVLKNVNIKKIYSDNKNILLVLTEENNIYFHGFMNKYTKDKLTYKKSLEGSYEFLEWKWPKEHNYEIIDILIVNSDFVLFSLRKRMHLSMSCENSLFDHDENNIEYFIIGNDYLFNCFEDIKFNSTENLMFFPLDNPKKFNFNELYKKLTGYLPKAVIKTDVKTKLISPQNNDYQSILKAEKMRISSGKDINKQVISIKPAIIKTNKTPNKINKEEFKQVIDKKIIEKTNEIDKTSNSIQTINSSKIKELQSDNEGLKENPINIEKIFYIDSIKNESYNKYALVFTNNYNEIKYFEQIENRILNSADSYFENISYIIGIFKITSDTLQEFKNIYKFLGYNYIIEKNEVKIVYLIIQIKISGTKLLITPIIDKINIIEYNLNSYSLSIKFILEFFSNIESSYIQNLNIEEMLKEEVKFLMNDHINKENLKESLININLKNEMYLFVKKAFDQLKYNLFVIDDIYFDLSLENPIYRTFKDNKLMSLECIPFFSKNKVSDIMNSNIFRTGGIHHKLQNKDFTKFIDLCNKYEIFLQEKRKTKSKINENVNDPENFEKFYLKNFYNIKNYEINQNLMSKEDDNRNETIEANFNLLKIINIEYLKSIDKYISENKNDTDAIFKLYYNNKNFIEDKKKQQFFEEKFSQRSTSKIPISLDRIKAIKFSYLNIPDKEFNYTIFSQVFKSLKSSLHNYIPYHIANINHTLFYVNLIGEGASDGGGPGREVFTSIFADLFSDKIDLFIRTPNNKTNTGIGRDLWTINPSANSDIYLDFFKVLGKLMTFSYFSKVYCDMNLPKIFWKCITEDEINKEDLEEIDFYAYNNIVKIAFDENILNKNYYEEWPLKDYNFTALLSNGDEIELVENGKNISVNKWNFKKFRELYLKARLEEGKIQMNAIKEGIK